MLDLTCGGVLVHGHSITIKTSLQNSSGRSNQTSTKEWWAAVYRFRTCIKKRLIILQLPIWSSKIVGGKKLPCSQN